MNDIFHGSKENFLNTSLSQIYPLQTENQPYNNLQKLNIIN